MFLSWEGHHRSLVKAISWRLAGSVDTLILSYLVTKNLVFAGSIASAEAITKTVLYYIHERAWTIIPWGKRSRRRRMGLHWRIWIAQGLTAAGDLTFHLRRLFNPAGLGMIGSFVFCFAIALSPPLVRLKPSVMTGSPVATGYPESGLTATALLERATTQSVVLDPSHEGSYRAPEPTELPRVTETPPQALKTAAQVEIPKRNLLDHDHATEVQQMLIQLGYLSRSATGISGPLSRKALKAFKSDHNLPADEIWDEATERTLFGGSTGEAEPFVGIWGVDASACSPRLNRKGFLPAVIDGRGAWAGETSCALESKKHTASGWEVVAVCSNGRDRWTANIRLIISGDQLTWTSERGSQSYLRCQPGLGVARVL